MSIYKKLAKDTTLFALSSFASKILIFVLLPLYTRVLSTEEYGIVDLLINLTNIIYPIVTISIAEGTLRFALNKEKDQSKVISISVFVMLAAGAFITLLSPICMHFMGDISQYWFAFIMLFMGYGFHNIFSYYCKGKDNVKIFAIQGIMHTGLTLGLNLLFLLVFKWGMKGYLFATIVSYYIVIVYIFFAIGIYKEIRISKFDRQLFKEMIKYTLPMMPSMIAWWINTSADKYVIIALISIGASGMYSVAHKIPSALNTIADIFNQAFLLSSVSDYDGDNKTSNFYTNTSKYYVEVCIILAFGLVFGSEIMGKILFAKEYFEAWTYVPVLVVASVFSSLAAYLATISRTIMKTNVLFISTGIGALINIILNYLFILEMGIIGAAYATLISFVIVFLIRWYIVNKYVPLSIITIKNIILIALLLAGMFVMTMNVDYKYVICIGLGLVMCVMIFKDMWNVIKKKM